MRQTTCQGLDQLAYVRVRLLPNKETRKMARATLISFVLALASTLGLLISGCSSTQTRRLTRDLQIARETDNYRGRIRVCEALLAKASKGERGRLLIEQGTCHWKLGESEAAREAFEAAERVGGGTPEVSFFLGHEVVWAEPKEAERRAREALLEAPTDPWFNHLLGLALANQGRHAESASALLDAAGHAEDSDVRLALLLSGIGQHLQAEDFAGAEAVWREFESEKRRAALAFTDREKLTAAVIAFGNFETAEARQWASSIGSPEMAEVFFSTTGVERQGQEGGNQ